MGSLLGGLVAGLALTGCTSAPAGGASPTPEVTSAGASSLPAPSASASPSPSVSETEPSPSSASPDAVTIDITISDGQVTPSGKKLDVEVGQTIVLNVSSDEADEVHAHTEGDGYELAVAAGKRATGKFSINSPGSYEVESHHLEKVIVVLNAR